MSLLELTNPTTPALFSTISKANISKCRETHPKKTLSVVMVVSKRETLPRASNTNVEKNPVSMPKSVPRPANKHKQLRGGAYSSSRHTDIDDQCKAQKLEELLAPVCRSDLLVRAISRLLDSHFSHTRQLMHMSAGPRSCRKIDRGARTKVP